MKTSVSILLIHSNRSRHVSPVIAYRILVVCFGSVRIEQSITKTFDRQRSIRRKASFNLRLIIPANVATDVRLWVKSWNSKREKDFKTRNALKTITDRLFPCYVPLADWKCRIRFR